MRILIVTNMYPTDALPFYGIFVKEHVDGLRRLGVHMDVFFTNPKETRAAYLTRLVSLVRSVRKGAYDLLHVQHSYCVYQLWLARFFLRRWPPLLFTIHEGEALYSGSARAPEGDALKQLIYSRRLKRWALQRADRVISVERHLPRVVGYTKTYEVIPPGVDTQLFRPMCRAECRRMLGLPAQETILFFPADPRRSFNKGFDLLQAGLNLLKSSARLITGGAIAHDQMPLYLNAADLVIQTSRYEASPMIVKEAMACQRPLVSTDVGDVREVFGRTPGYWLCAPTPEDIARKMEAALRFDQPLRGRERILELGLSLEQVAEKYLSRYTQLIHQERIYAHSSS